LKEYGPAWYKEVSFRTGVSEQIALLAGITAAPTNGRWHEVNTKYWISTPVTVREARSCAHYKQVHRRQEWGNVHKKRSPTAIKRTQYIVAAAILLLRLPKESKKDIYHNNYIEFVDVDNIMRLTFMVPCIINDKIE
jgi:hypothetical protein